MTKYELIQIITGFIGSCAFAILFNIRGKRFAATAFGGFLSWLLFVILSRIIQTEALNYFIVAALISLYAEIMARALKTPTTTFITTSLIPLIPGGSLYYTIAYAFESNTDKFVGQAISTVTLASALALGIITATTLTNLLFRFILKPKPNNS
ncbi:MAG: threonine/serine exporter family protein [Clostridia bacterium]|nr:threonine/serine exporter family protein [Clostridia bacterium]